MDVAAFISRQPRAAESVRSLRLSGGGTSSQQREVTAQGFRLSEPAVGGAKEASEVACSVSQQRAHYSCCAQQG